jgi:hypothetical protein
MSDTSPVVATSAHKIAWRQFIETAIIVLLALSAALATLGQQLSNVVGPQVTAELVVGTTVAAAVAKALVAFLNAIHNVAANAAAPQAIVATTVPVPGDNQDRPQQIIGTTVPASVAAAAAGPTPPLPVTP